ncbi:hypothetical protein MH117_20240 [Paenibacillus sp. ACRRX]|uniref:hypothetical protein n=1 Tax=Paenibacillus sp. ACRRX TaxID=2918206 RepID=UPI001EF4E18C|nr:hypothetical protein [Paenibacillus sp. ACRRX]MCG7409739.1 hypothetical protein [Paenibacillus sp. ACRRX]
MVERMVPQIKRSQSDYNSSPVVHISIAQRGCFMYCTSTLILFCNATNATKQEQMNWVTADISI